ncbi:exopolysaccharide biosynthesis polyprenyl glycosylphosphotransferase [Blastococcus fimeti]|nr:exopolysaccharide biosynthesis polyprenyl glycosylphosphotransferase [Blastococcus fimeti]
MDVQATPDIGTARPSIPRARSGSTTYSGPERRLECSRQRLSWAAEAPYRAHPDAAAGADGASGASPADPSRAAERRRRSWTRPLVRRTVAGDLICALAVLPLVVLSNQQSLGKGDAVGVALITVAWLVLLTATGAYDWRRIGDGPDEFRSIARSALVLLAALSVVAYSARHIPPRRYVLIAIPLLALATAVHRKLLRTRLHTSRAQGWGLLRTLVVGEPLAAHLYSSQLNARSFHGYHVVGACLHHPRPGGEVSGLPVWGTVSEVPQIVVEQQIDVVLVVGSQLVGEPLRRLTWALERVGADLVLAPGLVEVAGGRTRMRPAAGLSLIHVDNPAYVREPLLKEVFDRVLGTLFLLLATPVLLVAMAAVRLGGRGPVFYRQLRVGRNGKPFRMFKLRTMVPDADRSRAGLLDLSDRDGLMFKMRNDPRVTPVGRWLRRSSVDELPQLWNVVRGDMALVGPRPPLPEEHAAYQDAVHRRLHVKPGITGLWQVSGRADLSWDESVRLDLRYVDNWSIMLDLEILWKTVRAVVHGKGAY